MATTPSNTLRRKIAGLHAPWSVDITLTYNQGDLLYFDDAVEKVKPGTDDDSMEFLVGVALQSFPVTSLGTGEGSTRQPSMEVGDGDIFEFKTTSGETLNDGEKVYIGADAQTVTTTAGTFHVGIVRLLPGQSPITGAAGVFVQVEVFRRFKG